MIDLVQYTLEKYPRVKGDLLSAHMEITPHDFIKRALTGSFMYGLVFMFLAIFPIVKAGIPVILVIFVFPIVFFMTLTLQLNVPKAAIKRRGREIDNEVVFAGRFLLIKLSSGKPLFNSLIDTSQSYGVASKYFKEIVDDINFGTSIENALNNAMEASPSRYFKQILFQINNAIKVGIDVTENLEVVIEEIEHEQALEIERYAKKLSSVALFYMLGAIVVPSLGMTLFVVVGSMISFPMGMQVYIVILVLMILIQLFFMTVFKQIRPSVNV